MDMVPINDLVLFALAALTMVVSPGPNMLYLISRSIVQGQNAGIISLFGVVCGFLFHILMVSFGLTAIFVTLPYAFFIVKFLGVGYLLYLAYKSISSKNQILDANKNTEIYRPVKLFNIGFMTNVLNPKMAVFYLSFFPQFIRPENGSILSQSFQLGMVQIIISFTINFLIIITVAKMGVWISNKTIWYRIQKWFMASVFTGLALKMVLTKAK